ncbi:PREDICTED: thionin-like protein 2 [Theobroma cacao]|uniref:Thionin-like protein 2 n=2 Tax=Theobroma cacao TaxID=3641 RepID=A0AB32UZJ0_THECC|nr:PREDICTED: thionin-like protein 2 [Theobroma cacao]EOY26260.1 To encode a PR protein, Belongs to the plant thionin family with the following members:, putative [Theobroma cacao]
MGGRGVLMVCLVLGLLMGHSHSDTSFQICYCGCFVSCVITPGNNAFSCAINCLQECIFRNYLVEDTQYFCKLGCSTSKCTSLSSKENPAEANVGSCVDSCSDTCAVKN